MKKLLMLYLAVSLVATVAVAMPGSGPSSPAFPDPNPLDTGGPDAFGYSWVDNDGGGGPTYNWIDITGNGTHLVGLADDNNLGPISMGFQFPYYWYYVNHMWIGSNGYISFSFSNNYAHPFTSIPDPDTLPNDLVAVLTGDLDFTRGGSCYYYSNNVDTFIVSWIGVPQFSADHGLDDSTHTFQLILSARDSSLTFQYAENHGNFNENGNLQDVIGIENVNGQVGLEYMEDNLPANRMWHSNLAIKFTVVPNPSYVVHDMGVLEGMNESSGAVFVHDDSTFTPTGLIKNFGNQVQTNVPVRCQIRRGSASPVYDHYDTIATIQPSEQVWLNFPDYAPTQTGTWRITFTTVLSGDANSLNNTKTIEMPVYTLPQELRYDDNISSGTGRSWNGDFSGFGVEFQVPEPIKVTHGSFNVEAVTADGPAYIWIMPDSSGHPYESNILAGDTVQITSDMGGSWVDVDFSWADLEFAANAKFYLVVLHALQNTFSFAMDNSVPLSNRGWEYTGGLAPDRDRGSSDIMFKVMADTISGAQGVDEGALPKTFSLAQNYPNPFNAQTSIRFSLTKESDVRFDIYNIAGQRIDAIFGHYGAGSNSLIWDASAVASGVYFYKMSVGDISQTRRMVLVK
jgi:hypothetical protein